MKILIRSDDDVVTLIFAGASELYCFSGMYRLASIPMTQIGAVADCIHRTWKVLLYLREASVRSDFLVELAALSCSISRNVGVCQGLEDVVIDLTAERLVVALKGLIIVARGRSSMLV
jgi:hypothetical protein